MKSQDLVIFQAEKRQTGVRQQRLGRGPSLDDMNIWFHQLSRFSCLEIYSNSFLLIFGFSISKMFSFAQNPDVWNGCHKLCLAPVQTFLWGGTLKQKHPRWEIVCLAKRGKFSILGEFGTNSFLVKAMFTELTRNISTSTYMSNVIELLVKPIRFSRRQRLSKVAESKVNRKNRRIYKEPSFLRLYGFPTINSCTVGNCWQPAIKALQRLWEEYYTKIWSFHLLQIFVFHLPEADWIRTLPRDPDLSCPAGS